MLTKSEVIANNNKTLQTTNCTLHTKEIAHCKQTGLHTANNNIARCKQNMTCCKRNIRAMLRSKRLRAHISGFLLQAQIKFTTPCHAFSFLFSSISVNMSTIPNGSAREFIER